MQLIHDCQKCGNCCVNMGGIAFNSSDTIRMATQLGISKNDFIKAYTRASKNKASDRWLNVTEKEACIFWSKDGCTQYQGRGQVCRLYPFTSPELLDMVRKHRPWGIYDRCPGMKVTYKKVLEESLTFSVAGAKAIVESDLGKICVLNTVRAIYQESAAKSVAEELGLEDVPSLDRLRLIAKSYALAYVTMNIPREIRLQIIAELEGKEST